MANYGRRNNESIVKQLHRMMGDNSSTFSFANIFFTLKILLFIFPKKTHLGNFCDFLLKPRLSLIFD
jgi:hypothetical protein